MYSELSASLVASLDLKQPPVAISFTDSIPAGVKAHAGSCRLQPLEEGASRVFATSASDHSLCAIGVYTHNLHPSPAQQTDLMDGLKVFGDFGYVRPEDLALIRCWVRSRDMSCMRLGGVALHSTRTRNSSDFNP